MSYLTQMLGLTVQNFVSAATGMAVLVALDPRASRAARPSTIGNFWVDLTRATLYILLPLVARARAGAGLAGRRADASAPTRTVAAGAAGRRPPTASAVTRADASPLGPAASQVAIKQLGTNGGGFFNANSAHPFENPTPLSNFLEMLAILLIPAALCYTFGEMVGDPRQGWALLAAMTLLFVPARACRCLWPSRRGNPRLAALGVDARAGALQPGGNMEGKEARFGIANSALWATATTAASNGSVNSMHDSFTPLGGLVPMLLMQLGEVIFGGVGSGLYGMLIFAIIAVFVAGLMVGRTPEYLGKKIEAFEMKMASLVILIPPLVGAARHRARGARRRRPRRRRSTPGAHGFSEILYAFSSAGNNNGSAFAGPDRQHARSTTWRWRLAMLVGRYWLADPGAGHRRLAGRARSSVPAGAGHAAHPHAAVRRAARRRSC